MSARHRHAAPLTHRQAARTARTTIGESLLLRFLVQRGIVHQSLLKLIEVERAGSGTTLSLVDWLVQRGHVSEAALTSVLAACLKLQPNDLTPFASFQSEGAGTEADANPPKSARHLKLVSSRPRASSDASPTHATSSPDRRRTPLHLPRLVCRSA
jgi:hypothetical protein